MSSDAFEYLHFRVPGKTRRIIDRIAAERGSSLAAVCRDLIMDSPLYIATCHDGHPSDHHNEHFTVGELQTAIGAPANSIVTSNGCCAFVFDPETGKTDGPHLIDQMIEKARGHIGHVTDSPDYIATCHDGHPETKESSF